MGGARVHRWIICARKGASDLHKAVPSAIADVPDTAKAAADFNQYLRKRNQVAFRLDVHGLFFMDRCDLEALPVVTIPAA